MHFGVFEKNEKIEESEQLSLNIGPFHTFFDTLTSGRVILPSHGIPPEESEIV